MVKQSTAKPVEEQHSESSARLKLKELHSNIQIVLPETRDVAVFDAIFESLRKSAGTRHEAINPSTIQSSGT